MKAWRAGGGGGAWVIAQNIVCLQRRQPNNITFDAAPALFTFWILLPVCEERERSAHATGKWVLLANPLRRRQFPICRLARCSFQLQSFASFTLVGRSFSFLLHLDVYVPLLPNFQRKCAATAEIVIRWQMLTDFNLKLLSSCSFFFAHLMSYRKPGQHSSKNYLKFFPCRI